MLRGTLVQLAILYNCIVPSGFHPWEIWVAFLRESQLQQLHYPACFSVSIIYQSLIQPTGSLMSAQMFKRMQLHTGVYRHYNRICTES